MRSINYFHQRNENDERARFRHTVPADIFLSRPTVSLRPAENETSKSEVRSWLPALSLAGNYVFPTLSYFVYCV